ncbi:anthranilate synthase component II [Natroniella sp. ANB-PHB2]|uniref:anthranilate synthase component II n=1 Tax=Natroniella sp. ANB-PHB2 TaxID=3384444 RepID=UPI0038D3A5DE
MVLVIDNYDSFTYNLVQLIGKLGAEVEVRRNDQITIAEIRELNPEQIVISPGPGRPKDAGISLQVVEQLAGEIPILGICLGHQTIGAAYGAEIVSAPELVHGKVSKIKHQQREILAGVADQFEATRYHSLMIEPGSLPANLEVIAETEKGLIMGVADSDAQLYGLQFHPESIMSEAGERIIGSFLGKALNN